ncbi:hypothetical protein EAV90_09895 [Bradyrhizobium vignae]|nr:hypothetical protein EAV90_09895 [Bradyrhizobium vignae]
MPRRSGGAGISELTKRHFPLVMRGLDPPAGPKPLRRGEGPRIPLLEEMGCRVKPGNDQHHPLTRSTRATTAFARSWARIALRCFRS